MELFALLARAGTPGRELGVRLDLALALGPRGALRRLRGDASLASLAGARDVLYASLWREAAAELGAEVAELGSGFLELRKDRRRTRVLYERTMLDDVVTIELSEDKAVVHRLLTEAGLPVPEHLEFDVRRPAPAKEFLGRGAPCVVKPAAQTDVGVGVTTGIRTWNQLVRASLRAARSGPRLLIERQARGEVYRLLLLDGELLDTVRRRAPTLVGDGRATVEQLIAAENRRRVAAAGRDGLWLLKIDLDCLLALERQGLGLRSVPGTGERVAVKSVTNQNRVEDNETVREAVAPALVGEAAAAAAAVGLRLAGVDLVTRDLSVSLVESGGVVLEVNCTPGLHHHALVADRAAATRVAVPILRALLDQPPE